MGAIDDLVAKLAGDIPVEAYLQKRRNKVVPVVAHERGLPDAFDIDHPLRKYPITHFQSRTCTRCGGGGEYSYNMRDGTTCYGCSGMGRQLTKKGAEGYQMWQASKKAAKEPLASEVEVGDVVSTRDPETGKNVWATISEIEDTEEVSGGIGVGDYRNKTDEMIPTSWFRNITYTRGGELFKTEKVSGAQYMWRKPKKGQIVDFRTLPGYVGFDPTGWLMSGR